MRHGSRAAVSVAALSALALLTGCGAAGGPTVTPSPTATPTATPAPTDTPTAPPTPAATAAQLEAVAASVYPACHSSCQGQGTNFTVCDQGTSPRWAHCPLSARLVTQVGADVQGVQSAPDPLGGGQDPYWATESITADPSLTGGVAHVVLGFGSGSLSHTDLVMVLSGGQLLVDDIVCTGTDLATTDAYAPGWLNRSTCSS